MKVVRHNIKRPLSLVALVLLFAVFLFIIRAYAVGDGLLLKRSPEETCHGCHKTDQNAPGDANSLKTHNSINTGSTKWAAQGGWGVTGGKYGEFRCTTCHTAHDTKNIYLLKETIATPDGSNWASSGAPTVNVLFKKKNLADSPNPGVSDGVMGDDTGGHSTSVRVCEVCHSQTNKHSYAIGADPGHQNATDCTQCHAHKNAFAHGGGSGTGCGTATTCHGVQGAHAPHVGGMQVGVNCSECHDTNNFPQFKDGQNLTNTTVCNNCHTAAGAITAKTYWDHPGSSSGTAGSWAVTLGEASFCGSCHGAIPGNTQGNGLGVAAFNAMGNGSTYGYAITGHGKLSGNYQRMSWQDAAATGNQGANKVCSECHDLTAAHFNNVNKRLKTGYENDANNSNCRQCHDPGTTATANPQWYTTYAAFQNSAHSGIKCTACHEVHGAAGTFAAMTTADKQALCNTCHSGAGAHPGVGTKAFTVNSKNYTLQCSSCHNVHLVTGRYNQADQNKSPVTRFLDNLQVWGDTVAEKISAYAGSGTYRKPTGESFTGDQLPDYATFCLDCHGAGGSGSVFFGIDWAGDNHGKVSANQPNGYGTCPNWFACGQATGWDGDDCTGTQAECWPTIPRGKGDQLFSRAPFNHEERIAGANFTLSCTDCHTGHGTGTLGRSNVNGGPFTSNWNNMCNRCHYYYSDWHAGMSCGNASCHVSARMNSTGTATPHAMASQSGSGGTRTFDPTLVLNYAFENNLKDSGTGQMDGKWYSTAGSFAAGKTGQAAVLGEDITVQVGTENGYWSTDEGYHGTWKFTEMKYNTSLETWVYPTDNAKSEYTIFNKHVGVSSNGGYAFRLKKIDGTLRATFNMTADNNAGTQDGRAGVRGAYSSVAVPLNKWTHVAATFDTGGPDRNPADPAAGRIRIYMNGVDVTTSDPSGNNMQPGANETSIYAYSENSPWNQSICYNGSWCASEFSIGGFDWESTNFIGRIDDAKVWNATKPSSYFAAIDAANAPEIVSAEVTRVNQLTVTFSEGVYTNNDSTGALVPADFVYTDTDNGRTIAAVTHTAGSRTAVLTLSSDLDTSNDVGVDTVKAAANSIFDKYALAAGTTAVTISGNLSPPTINSAVVSSSNKVTVTFSKAVYTNSDLTGALAPSDFTYTDTDNGRTITAVQHTAGSTTAVLTLSSNIDANNDIGVDTVAAVANSIFDNMGFAAGTNAVTISGSLCPSPATFNLNEAPGSTTVQDSQGYLIGSVYGTSVMTGNEYSGNGSGNYIAFTGNDACLQATTALTLEARIKPAGITVTGNNNYIARIFARNYSASSNYQLSVWRNNTAYPGLFTAPDNQAVIALWALTDGTTTWKPVLTNYTGAKNGPENDCPIVSNHWYQVKAVWNTNKPGGTPGQYFTPADIYIDDQGTDGNGAGENWSGYLNCTDTDQSLKTDSFKFYTNDRITSGNGQFAIGANTSSTTNNRFNGLIDWIQWQDTVVAPGTAPTIGTPSTLSTTSIRWNFTDTTPDETGFKVHDSAHTAVASLATPNLTYLDETGLTANTQYTRHIHAYNDGGDSPGSGDASRYTLSMPPNLTADKTASTWYSTANVVFANTAGFGAGGVQYYRYAWNQNATYTFTGAEPQWTLGPLTMTSTAYGGWYLHVKSYNGDDLANGTQTYGPYYYDNVAPTVSSASPSDGAAGVALNGNVTITWSENVDCATVDTTNIIVSGGGWALSSCATNQAVFATGSQTNSTTYTVTVTTGVKDTAGNAMAADYPFSYTTVP